MELSNSDSVDLKSVGRINCNYVFLFLHFCEGRTGSRTVSYRISWILQHLSCAILQINLPLSAKRHQKCRELQRYMYYSWGHGGNLQGSLLWEQRQSTRCVYKLFTYSGTNAEAKKGVFGGQVRSITELLSSYWRWLFTSSKSKSHAFAIRLSGRYG